MSTGLSELQREQFQRSFREFMCPDLDLGLRPLTGCNDVRVEVQTVLEPYVLALDVFTVLLGRE